MESASVTEKRNGENNLCLHSHPFAGQAWLKTIYEMTVCKHY